MFICTHWCVKRHRTLWTLCLTQHWCSRWWMTLTYGIRRNSSVKHVLLRRKKWVIWRSTAEPSMICVQLDVFLFSSVPKSKWNLAYSIEDESQCAELKASLALKAEWLVFKARWQQHDQLYIQSAIRSVIYSDAVCRWSLKENIISRPQSTEQKERRA